MSETGGAASRNGVTGPDTARERLVGLVADTALDVGDERAFAAALRAREPRDPLLPN
ncbi:hypothetical protein OR263_25025 [Streptomyces sp. NEAU-H22]|uniref:hypothetical protein n=1 Tax=unclassified Streptomyces TaxID=2593676 RepID=UPI002251202B|nr:MULTISPECIES: hypothetical protein [unclassified Streptomyces]MCX3289931.1 hypothetical protein [Streptomyces sp. NEAU-H22]WMD06604.1 hypothetical protein Q7C01_20420 [Streptomyces sp. FXY-T5]